MKWKPLKHWLVVQASMINQLLRQMTSIWSEC